MNFLITLLKKQFLIQNEIKQLFGRQNINEKKLRMKSSTTVF